MSTWGHGLGMGHNHCRVWAMVLVFITAISGGVSAQSPGLGSLLSPQPSSSFSPLRPPADIPGADNSGAALVAPGPPLATSPPAGRSPGVPVSLAPPGSSSPAGLPLIGAVPSQVPLVVPPGQVALAVSARFGRDTPVINGALHWRVYSDKLDQSGTFRLIKEDSSPTPTFVLPPGGYVVHVAFGLASAVKHVQLRSETVREVFEMAAGGARFEGRVGDTRIPSGQVSFDIFPGSQFEQGEKPAIAQDVAAGDLVLLPEGTYHVASNYGDGNAVVRSDIRIQPGKLIDVRINHRAAVITLKLVTTRGGEALANTAWSVLTPGGDVIKESIGAFPKVILTEGDYVVIARNEGKIYNYNFKVEAGVDSEVEVVAR